MIIVGKITIGVRLPTRKKTAAIMTTTLNSSSQQANVNIYAIWQRWPYMALVAGPTATKLRPKTTEQTTPAKSQQHSAVPITTGQ